MNLKVILLSSFFALFLSSAIPSERHTLKIGEQAPRITLAPGSLNESKSLLGENAIINFWSASDPSSRIANITLSRLAESGKNADRNIISVCLDDDISLANEIASIDGISDKIISLNKADVSLEFLEDYQTSSGCRCFITDSFGNLSAMLLPEEVSTNVREIY